MDGYVDLTFHFLISVHSLQQNHLRHQQHRLPPPSFMAASDWLAQTDQKHPRPPLFTTPSTSSFANTNTTTNSVSSPWSFNHIYAQ